MGGARRSLRLFFFLEARFYFLRDGFASHSSLRLRIPDSPDSFFCALRCQLVSLVQFVFNLKTAASPCNNPRLDRHCLSKGRRHVELRSRINQRNSQQSIGLQHFRFSKSGLFKKRIRASVKVFEKSREIDNPSGIAVSPLDVNLFSVAQHLHCSPGEHVESTVSRSSHGIRFSCPLFPFTL